MEDIITNFDNICDRCMRSVDEVYTHDLYPNLHFCTCCLNYVEELHKNKK